MTWTIGVEMALGAARQQGALGKPLACTGKKFEAAIYMFLRCGTKRHVKAEDFEQNLSIVAGPWQRTSCYLR
jgi:hypothetical protein